MITTLDNGLPVVLDFMPNMESVVLSVWVKVGGAFELQKQNGLAHFLEHMAFKGTAKRTAFDIAMEFDSIGGLFNACTGKESTVYYAKSLRADFAKSCDIISDVILNSQFDPTEIANEKKVVLQEIAGTKDEAEDLVQDHFMQVAYGDCPFGNSILGLPDIVNSFSRQDLLDFVHEYYTADNMFVVVSGNFFQQEVLDLLNNKFSTLSKKNDNRRVYQGSIYKGGFCWEERDLDQLHIVFGFEGVSYVSPNYYERSLLAAILGGGISSRLFQEVREKRGLAYSIGSYSDYYHNTGLFVISTGISPDHDTVQEFFRICGDQLRDLSRNLEKSELDRVKSQLRASLLMKMEGVFTRSEFAGVLYRYFGHLISKEEILQRIESITVESIRAEALAILDTLQHSSCAMIGKGCKQFSKDKIIQFVA